MPRHKDSNATSPMSNSIKRLQKLLHRRGRKPSTGLHSNGRAKSRQRGTATESPATSRGGFGASLLLFRIPQIIPYPQQWELDMEELRMRTQPWDTINHSHTPATTQVDKDGYNLTLAVP